MGQPSRHGPLGPRSLRGGRATPENPSRASADADPAALGQQQRLLALRDAELDVGAALLQTALAAALDLVDAERRGVEAPVAGERVAVALQPRGRGLAGPLLAQRVAPPPVLALLGRHPERL